MKEVRQRSNDAVVAQLLPHADRRLEHVHRGARVTVLLTWPRHVGHE